jgi:hypothetical protein
MFLRVIQPLGRWLCVFREYRVFLVELVNTIFIFRSPHGDGILLVRIWDRARNLIGQELG